MPSSINISGLRQYRPGIYAVIDASSLGGSGVSTGNIAIIGDFPSVQAKTLYAFSSARALSDWSLGDPDLQLAGKIAFSPSLDDRVAGGAARLFVVNAGTNTRAQAEVPTDWEGGTGKGTLSIKSRLWGAAGNRMSFDVASGGFGSTMTITVKYNGEEEVFRNVGSGDLFTMQYTGAVMTRHHIFYGSNQWSISWGFDQIMGAGPTVVAAAAIAEMQFGETGTLIRFAPSSVNNPPDVDAVIVGTDVFGVAQTETVTISAAEVTAETTRETLKKYASIASIQLTSSTGVPVPFQIKGDAIFDPSGYTSVKAITTLWAGFPGWTLVEKSPRLSSINPTLIDYTVISDASALTDGGLTANALAVVSALKLSAFVEAEINIHEGAIWHTIYNPLFFDAGPGNPVALSGGTQASPDTAGYTDALEDVLSADVQIVVPMSSNIDVHKAALQHCKDAMLYGSERCTWVGMPANQTLDNAFTHYSAALNSRHAAVVGQQISYSMPDGTTQTLEPMYLALMCAGMQAGTGVATPLTRKRPDVLDVLGLWDPVVDANDAIRQGIVNISFDNLGWRVERSVTTYLTDDNPIYSEVSANESINTSVRMLRARLDIQIGNPVVAATAQKIKGSVELALEAQVREGIIKAWQNADVLDLGDRFDISYEVAATEPLNFIKVTANVVRIAS